MERSRSDILAPIDETPTIAADEWKWKVDKWAWELEAVRFCRRWKRSS
jgi:hypothetical protein